MRKFLTPMVYFLIFLVFLKLALGIYGINWGNPDRWNVDDRITAAIRMISEKTFFYSSIQYAHPVFYYYFLIVILAPYFLFFKLAGFNFQIAKEAASVSWLNLTKVCPGFAGGLLIAGKISSLLLGVGTILAVFFLARKIYGARTAVFSAIVLALNVGLLGTNYLVKNENLALFLLVLVVYIWANIIEGKFDYRKFYISCLLSGLAIGTKLDSSILLFGIASIILYNLRVAGLGLKGKIRFITASCVFTALGILAGYPRLVVPAKAPGGIVNGAVKGFSLLFGIPGVPGFLAQSKMVALNLASCFNIVLSVFLVSGIILSIVKPAKSRKSVILLYILLVPYFIINVLFYKFTATKLLILSLPILSIFAGYGLEAFWDRISPRRTFRAVFFALILIYSFVYAVRADMVFASRDTRYATTRWLENNIPSGSCIGIIQEPELLFSSRLIGEYRFYYYQEELNYDNNAYLKIKERVDGNKEVFIPDVCRYVIVSSWDFMKFETGAKDSFYKDFCGNNGFVLLKKIEYKENLFFNPRPSYTCPVIFIFERKSTDAKSKL